VCALECMDSSVCTGVCVEKVCANGRNWQHDHEDDEVEFKGHDHEDDEVEFKGYLDPHFNLAKPFMPSKKQVGIARFNPSHETVSTPVF